MANSRIDALRRELGETSSRATELWSKHSAEQLLRKPGKRKWSAAECVEHLNMTNRAYLPRIDEALRELEAEKTATNVPTVMNFNARVLRWWLEPPSWLKLPTSAAFQPLATSNAEEVLQTFRGLNARIDEQLSRGSGLALDKRMISSPFAETMKYNVYSAFVLIVAHNRRHLWQAANSLGAQAFSGKISNRA
jgi:hypothetical protein